MSGTLGDISDLRRSYGVRHVDHIDAGHAQSGRRFIFVPELYGNTNSTSRFLSAIWDGLSSKRALLLTPSWAAADRQIQQLGNVFTPSFSTLGPGDIEKGLSAFTSANNCILSVPGRYDGIDLPDDACRLLFMSEVPSAVGEQDTALVNQWAAGPAMQSRARTRLLQGLGRCTRGDTDYSVVIWLGQALVNAASGSSLRSTLPEAVRAELEWGKTQTGDIDRNPDEAAELVLGLLDDDEYRAEADDAVRDDQQLFDAPTPAAHPSLSKVVKDELTFAKSMWDGYYDGAYKAARRVTDSIGTSSLDGYRA